MPGDGRPTTSGHATARRFAAPHCTAPAARRQDPRGRRKYAEKQPSAPNRSPGPLAKSQPADAKCRTPASDLDVLQAVPARRPPPLRYSPARQHPPPRAPGRQTTRRRQAGPSTGRRRPRDSCIRTPPATASRTRPPQPASPRHRQPRRTASRGRDPARTIPIGLGLFHDWSRPMGSRYQHGFSTASGNDGKQPALSGQTGHETGPVNSRADRPGSRVHDRYNRRSNYRTSSPVIVRPISIRWISDVPSKIVKIPAVGTVSAGQRSAWGRSISTDPARPVRDECRFPSGPRLVSSVIRTHAKPN
jgi:hypothetical protein